MKNIFFLLISLTLSNINPCFAQAGSLLISTTTSVENSGLLAYLLPIFTKETGIEVKVLPKGTGAAIKDGINGNVDAILVHDLEREQDFVQKGFGTKRYYVMYNDFILIGPKNDPAKAKNAQGIVAAFETIARAKAPFISRGDDSGTHSREAKIWAMTELDLEKRFPTDNSWYRSIGQGMGKTILMADEVLAYTLSDRGSFYAMKYSQTRTKIELEIITEKQEMLLNPYGYIPVNPEKHSYVNIKDATLLGEWLVSSRGRAAITEFNIEGRQLFFAPR